MYTSLANALQEMSMSPAALPLAFLLGLVSAAAGACCALPAMGILTAWSGARQDANRRAIFVSAIWFLAGVTLALMIIGFVGGLVGRAAQTLLGRYWKLFAGVAAVLFGLATLKLLPFKLPGSASKADASSVSGGKVGAALGGLFLGGGVAACSLPCNPGIFIVIGAGVLMGRILWAATLMAAFAIGFGLPLSAVFFGVSFGKTAIKAQKADAAIRVIAGVLLVCVGFYLMATL